ncbi:hypothetical protein [Phenylobacterium sp.]|uniref:hypothetical protein n=1 Tax=Phenylobacterium sp. TaxID=1871053 RepID=UPI0011F94F4C|nr:hypothetical protein [Phenylobacterium sp.]THD64728.1 MAG: hypothetical protein E8A49_01390 [Phenylobacterium sp.]
MTPFFNDPTNPFLRPSLWPGLPHTPLALGIFPPDVRRKMAQAWRREQAAMAAPEPTPTPMPMPISAPTAREPTPSPASRPKRMRRLAPLIAAALVGASGLLTLFWLIGRHASR